MANKDKLEERENQSRFIKYNFDFFLLQYFEKKIDEKKKTTIHEKELFVF